MEGCPCPACEAGHPRGYLRYLMRNRELTGVRLLTLHNLAYIARLMTDLRSAITAGTLAERASALRAGEPPAAHDAPAAHVVHAAHAAHAHAEEADG